MRSNSIILLSVFLVSIGNAHSPQWFAKWMSIGCSIEGFFSGRSPFVRYLSSYQSRRLGNYLIKQGSLYELDVIDHLQKNNHIICSVCQKKECNNKEIKREFDIETEETLIECKDINWKDASGTKSTAIKKQLEEQMMIAEFHGKPFKVYSRRPVSPKWTKWLAKRNIPVVVVDA